MLITNPSSLDPCPQLGLPPNRTHSYCKGHRCFATLLGSSHVAMKLCWDNCQVEAFFQSPTVFQCVGKINPGDRRRKLLPEYLQKWC